MRVATRVTGGISGVGDVSLMRVDVGNEDREKVDDRRRRRPTLRAWSVPTDPLRHLCLRPPCDPVFPGAVPDCPMPCRVLPLA